MTPREAGGQWWRGMADYGGLLVVLALLIALFGATAKNFLTPYTFRTIANEVPEAIIVAVGMTYVLIIAGIDLSVGSVMALSSAVLGACLVRVPWPGWPPWLVLVSGLVGCLATGLLCGALNGLVTVAWRLPAFIVTLGMLQAARGATFLVTDMETLYLGSRIDVLHEIGVLGLSLPFLIAVAVVVAGQAVLSLTPFGRHVVAVGGNEEAARLSGVRPGRVRFAVFGLCGLLTAVAAVMHTSRLASSNPNTGEGFELEVIAAVVVGGTSLMGGRGSVVRSFLGVLIIAVLGTGLGQLGAGEPTKRLFTGCVIVAAAVADYYRSRLGGRWR